MKKVEVFLVNSFTENGAGGNPAGVVLQADGLVDEEKLAIAQAVGYSETAFVCRDDEADFAVSFFTVTGEVDFCGHATLAAFSTMYHQGVIAEGTYRQRTKAGVLALSIGEHGRIVMQQKLPQYLGEFDYAVLAQLIGLDPLVLASTQLPIEVISTGLADVIVPVPYGYLETIQINESATSAFCEKHHLVSIHAFELNPRASAISASCRNFAPLFGIPEESATGSASGALACYLSKHLSHLNSNSFVFEQGRAMACTSHITASVESNQHTVIKVQVGGFANQFGTRQVCLPTAL